MRLAMKAMVTALFAASVSPAWAAPVVRTAAGPVEGIDKGAVEAFLGVPYAAPPVGANRWRAPGAVTPWKAVRNTSQFAPACYQGIAKPWGPYSEDFVAGAPISEDCLFLNVWKPAGAQKKLPVLVFIHGGGFGGGAGSLPVYDGAKLAAKGAVVITINYRVGVFGFLAHPALTAESGTKSSGNYGLLDQIAALKWVQKNVARFGGDAGNVTVSGESAGAASVNDLQVSPLAKGLFQKAISYSGATMAVDLPSLESGERVGMDLAAKLNVLDLKGLRDVSAEKLVDATRYVPGESSGPPRLVYVPKLDGYVVPVDPDSPAAPRVNRVPLLTGFNSAEMIDPSVRTPADFERAVRARYGDFADRLLALYPHATDAEAQASNTLLARDRYMSGLLVWARKRATSKKDPIYLYRHDHPYPAIRGQMPFGAFHSSHLAYVFGNLGLGNRDFGPQDEAVSKNWQDIIMAFVKTGNPTPHGLAWPAAHDEIKEVMGIGPDMAITYAVSTKERYVALREYAAAGGKLGLM